MQAESILTLLLGLRKMYFERIDRRVHDFFVKKTEGKP